MNELEIYLAKAKKKRRLYYLNNKERFRERISQYYSKNKEKIKAYAKTPERIEARRLDREKNGKKYAATRKQYWLDHLDEYKAFAKARYRKYRGSILAKAKQKRLEQKIMRINELEKQE